MTQVSTSAQARLVGLPTDKEKPRNFCQFGVDRCILVHCKQLSDHEMYSSEANGEGLDEKIWAEKCGRSGKKSDLRLRK